MMETQSPLLDPETPSPDTVATLPDTFTGPPIGFEALPIGIVLPGFSSFSHPTRWLGFVIFRKIANKKPAETLVAATGSRESLERSTKS